MVNVKNKTKMYLLSKRVKLFFFQQLMQCVIKYRLQQTPSTLSAGGYRKWMEGRNWFSETSTKKRQTLLKQLQFQFKILH